MQPHETDFVQHFYGLHYKHEVFNFGMYIATQHAVRQGCVTKGVQELLSQHLMESGELGFCERGIQKCKHYQQVMGLYYPQTEFVEEKSPEPNQIYDEENGTGCFYPSMYFQVQAAIE